MKTPNICVCVCTYNRATSLANTLYSLSHMANHDSVHWELLVIDNNSNDKTESVIKEFQNKLPLRYIHEENQGLSHARNRALKECAGEVLLFTDDDVRVDMNWLAAFTDAIRCFPDADYFGGRVLAEWPSQRPKWIRDEKMPLIGGLLVICDNGQEVRYYRDSDTGPFGASFGVRRRMFTKLSPFRVDLGPRAHVPGRGDDDEYLGRAKQAGYRGVYCGRSVCYHHTDPSRLRIRYMYRFGIQKGIAGKRISTDKDHGGSIVRELSYAMRGLFQLCKGRGDRFRQCVINMGIQRGMRQDS